MTTPATTPNASATADKCAQFTVCPSCGQLHSICDADPDVHIACGRCQTAFFPHESLIAPLLAENAAIKAENERLRAALKKLLSIHDESVQMGDTGFFSAADEVGEYLDLEAIRAALNAKGEA